MARVLVVGAGVVGLTCAVRLAEDGHRVDVVARDLPAETTSAVAAALWYPYRAYPQDRVLAWSARSYEVFADLARDEVPGVVMRAGTEVHPRAATEPWWRDAVPDVQHTTDVPPPHAGGWTFVAPVIEMPVYLAWLHARLEALGGTTTRLGLRCLPSGADVVVDAAGLGARLLAGDPGVAPVQGQVVRLAQWGLERWWLDGAAPGAGSGPTYVVPREHDVVVGGTDAEGEWSRTPSGEVAAAILARAARLVPEVATARVLSHKVGLRPARAAVRLERDPDDARVVHCYGHGGAGVTLSWGCAEEVRDLVGRAHPA